MSDMGLVVVGAAGRMGQTLIRTVYAIERRPHCRGGRKTGIAPSWRGCRRAGGGRPYRRHPVR